MLDRYLRAVSDLMRSVRHMKLKFETLFIILLVTTPCLKAYGNPTDSVLYSQKVLRDDRMFEDMFRAKRGMLFLTDTGIAFKSRRPNHSRFDFSIPYDQIKSIKTFYGFLIPNRIKIKTTTGEKYRLFTYRKRKIIKITRDQMEKN